MNHNIGKLISTVQLWIYSYKVEMKSLIVIWLKQNLLRILMFNSYKHVWSAPHYHTTDIPIEQLRVNSHYSCHLQSNYV